MRQAIVEALTERECTAKDLSQIVRMSEKDVAGHLEHIARSLKQRGSELVVIPATCLSCGFVFRGRKHFTRPGACPSCRSTRIGLPAFTIKTGHLR